MQYSAEIEKTASISAESTLSLSVVISTYKRDPTSASFLDKYGSSQGILLRLLS